MSSTLPPGKWTPAKIRIARDALRAHPTIAAAAGALGVHPTTLRVSYRAATGKDATAELRRVTTAGPRDISAALAEADAKAAQGAARALHSRLVESERVASVWRNVRPIPPIVARRDARKSGKRPATPVDVISDWHVGETVREAETLGRNTYNIAEARRRASNYLDAVLWFRRRNAEVQTCHDHVLVLAGDIISGNIHPELIETNECGLADQVSHAAAMIEPVIRELAAVARRVVIPCVSGNHARITVKSQIKTGWANSLETLLYRQLVVATRDITAAGDGPGVVWHTPEAEQVQVLVHDTRLQVQHGTQIKSQGGIGGILVPLTRFAHRCNTADAYVFGHFHQAHWFENVIVNGSLIGDSAYSRANGMSYREPEQVSFVIDAVRGVRHFERVVVT